MAEVSQLLEELAVADSDIADAHARINHQAQVVHELGVDGHDTTEAEDLLRVLRESLDAMRGYRGHILRDLARATGR
jgi:hypothetical protein